MYGKPAVYSAAKGALGKAACICSCWIHSAPPPWTLVAPLMAPIHVKNTTLNADWKGGWKVR
jgi:hypothetical protein